MLIFNLIPNNVIRAGCSRLVTGTNCYKVNGLGYKVEHPNIRPYTLYPIPSALRLQLPATSDIHCLNPITTHIRQFIFHVIIDAVFKIRQRIFGVAGPATQTNRLSGPIYLQWCPASAAPENITIHHLLPLIEGVSGESTAKNRFCQTKTKILNKIIGRLTN